MSESITVAAIAAIGNQRQIGKDGELLWDIPADLRRFKELTNDKAVVMGRKTWESLPANARPLPGRKNIVLTRDKDYQADGAVLKHDMDSALTYAKSWSQDNDQAELFIIGGEAIYTQALEKTDKLYVTLVDSDEDGDAFFPSYIDSFRIVNQKHQTGDGDIPSYVFTDLQRS